MVLGRLLGFALKQWIRLRYPDVPAIDAGTLRDRLVNPANQTLWIIDVRTAEEYQLSHLPGALPIENGDSLPSPAAAGQPSSEQAILVCCSVGLRSAAAVQRLRQQGYRKAVNLEGGLFEWVNLGHPLVQQGRHTRQVHPFNRFWGLLLNGPGHDRTRDHGHGHSRR